MCIFFQANHLGAAGHVFWDYVNRRRLIVPSLSYNQWNYYPLRPNGSGHVTNMLTFADAEIEIIPQPTQTNSSEEDESDTKPTHVFMDDAAEEATPQVTSRIRHQQMMDRPVGETIRKVSFINGINGKTDYNEGRAHSVTRNGKYLITSAHDNDSEERDHRIFLKHRQTVKDQVNEIRAACVKMHIAPTSCNCTPGEPCYHPWTVTRPDFNPGKQTIAASTELRYPNATGKYVPRSTPVVFEEFDWLSMQYFGQHMDDARGDLVHIDVVVPMGNSVTLLILDRRSAAVNTGLILLNVYSDDGLGATSGDDIWDEFMRDFRLHFELEEKDPDYFLSVGIHQDESIALFAAYSWTFTATTPLCLLLLYTLTTVRPFRWSRYPNSANNRNTFPSACATSKNAVLTAWFKYARSPHAMHSRKSALNLSRGWLLYV